MDVVEARQFARQLGRSRVNDSDYYAFDGGLNLAATPLQLKPGELIGTLNYEIAKDGGYSRVQGFERLDGRPAPSGARYAIMQFTAGVPANYPAVGTTINGATSGATGVLLTSIVETATGVGSVVIGRIAGTFQTGEPLRVASTVFATSSTGASVNSAADNATNLAYLKLAASDLRALITAVPGSGPVRGVAVYRGVVYAFRDNTGATACVMHRATPSGWQAIPSYPMVRFRAGSTEILPGQTVTGGTSGATAVVRRVVLKQGSWQGGTAQGFLILAPAAGALADAESLSVSGSPVATTASARLAVAIPPGGRYSFRVHNFYGHAGTIRLYGVSGVTNAFEFQDGAGEFYCPIETGMTDDRPTHLAVHRSYLWLSFAGGSLQKSGVADPVVFSVITGASEIGVGDEVTGFLENVSNALFVFARNKTCVVTGAGPDFALDDYAPESGALPFTIQRIGQGVYLDDRGFTTLSTSNRYGNFSSASVSERVDPLVKEFTARASCSMVARSRNAYRLFLDDGRFVSIGYRGDRIVGFMPCDLGVTMTCAYSDEDTQGRELQVLGGADGFVYQMDSGLNFDGERIVAFMRLPFHFSRSPSRQKRYRLADFDVRTQGAASMRIAPEYSYARADVKSDPVRLIELQGGGGFWNVANWNEFVWSAGPLAGVPIKLEGSGLSIGFLIAHQSDNEPPHTLQGVKLHVSFRRLNRESIA